ncbi:MAG TPA: hypothetical protein VMT30_01940 [Candidatus Saccharimonadia bacterium]|nr:hypothetical protein [Candidatus Saccharimonadia bacterium]
MITRSTRLALGLLATAIAATACGGAGNAVVDKKATGEIQAFATNGIVCDAMRSGGGAVSVDCSLPSVTPTGLPSKPWFADAEAFNTNQGTCVGIKSAQSSIAVWCLWGNGISAITSRKPSFGDVEEFDLHGKNCVGLSADGGGAMTCRGSPSPTSDTSSTPPPIPGTQIYPYPSESPTPTGTPG